MVDEDVRQGAGLSGDRQTGTDRAVGARPLEHGEHGGTGGPVVGTQARSVGEHHRSACRSPIRRGYVRSLPRPASRVPAALSSKPSSFTSISAVLLSLLPSISPTMSDSGADWIAASSTAVPVRPARRGAAHRDAAFVQHADELLRSTLRRIVALSGTGHRGIVGHQRVVRSGFGPATPSPRTGAKYSSSYRTHHRPRCRSPT